MTEERAIELLESIVLTAKSEIDGRKAKKYIEALRVGIKALEKQQAQVHCKDCKSWGMGVAGETDFVKCCKLARYMIGASGYCLFAENRNGY